MIAFNLLDDDWNFDFLLNYRTGRYDFNSDDLVTTLNVNKIVVLLSSCRRVAVVVLYCCCCCLFCFLIIIF